MRIEFQLQAVLQTYELDKSGIFSRIERETGISRRIVSGLYYNRRVGVTMNQLERLCQWLHSHDVPSEELPGALFRFCPSGLMNALTVADQVRIYSGLYFQRQASHMPKYWVSWADSEVASLIIKMLSSVAPADITPRSQASSSHGHKAPRMELILVPSHDAPFGEAPEAERPAPHSTMPARRIFRAMREEKAPTTNILIGSQRANLLVELFVADLFGCEPFADARGRLPFYLYREPSTSAPMHSCCGGSDQPADCPGSGPFGIYFRRKGQRWELCPSIPNEADAGIVIVRRAPGQGQTELAVFGCSALATRAMGELLRRDPDQFWGSLQRLKGGVEARVYVCRLSMRAATEVTGPRPDPVLEDAEVYPLELDSRARPKRAASVRRSVARSRA